MAATNKRGVFSLEKVLERQVDNNWTDILDPFIYVTSVHPATTAGPATGYFAGGYSPSGQDSRVDRIDYTNDSATTSPKGNLSTEQSYIYGGASSTSHGYAFGGWSSTESYSTVVSRIDYGNDTSTASPKGPLSVGRRQHSAVGNANYGYAGGGFAGPSWNQMSIIDRVDYSSDTGTMTAVNPAGMTPGAYMTISTGNQSYGYFAGGYEYWTIGAYTSFVRRLDYASDTSATTPKGPMTTQGGDGSGTGNANYGYYKTSGNTGSAIERLTYANDTATLSSRGGILTYTAYQRGATGSADYGYFGGGQTGTYVSYVDRIDYANDTAAAAPKGKLNVPKNMMATFSSREYGMPQTSSEKYVTPATQYQPPLPSPISAGPAYGYSGGGGAGTFGTRETGGSKVQRIDFASDTSTTSVRGNLAHEHLHNAAVGNATHGYVMGDLFTTTARSYTSRVTYASDSSTASPRGSLTVARGGGSATGNASYAWISGAWDWIYGGAGPNASVVDRIDFANDNVTASARGNLDRADGKIAASGNASYGWWMGGSGVTTVSRVDYGNDTATASPKGTLCATSYTNTAVGNINYGYTTRGNNSYTDFLRYDYANDTGASTPKGSLSLVRTDFAGATGSQSYGYFMGGTIFPTYYTTIDRIDYSNDTATASPKGNLSLMIAGSIGWRRAGGFSGQSNAFGGTPTAPSTSKLVDKGADGYTNDYPSQGYGYWAGGTPGQSRVDRLDYSNDTATASRKGDLFDYVKTHGGASNLTHGYTFGGETGSYGYYTSVVGRVDYSNDTATAAMKGPLSGARRYVASVGNTNFGYTGGGTNPSVPNVRSIIDRLDYSNDSATAVAKGSMVAMGNLYGYGAVGNQNFGYFMGGYNSGYRSEVQRVDYANDTNPTTWRSYLSTAGTQSIGAAGNANFGYVGYGYDPSSGRTIIDRIDYSNDTTVTRKGNLTKPGYYRAATGNGSYGYWSGLEPGGWAPGYYTDAVFDRLDYANDTATTLVKGSINPGSRKAAFSAAEGGTPTFAYIPRVRFIDLELEGTGATPEIPQSTAGPAYGYWAGGQGSPSSYHIDRLDFANDSAVGTPKGQLLTPTVRGGGTGNMTHGYTFGGSGSGSRVQRVDYANDTATASQRGPLWSPSNDYMSSVGNNDYGYTGGRPWSYPYYFGKVDYANDTATETQLGGSSTFYPGPGYYGYGATGNRNYGYFVGGTGTYVRRCDYSNDTAQLSIRGPLTANSNYCTATGNADYGYADNPGSSVSRIDYSNDTSSAVQRGPLNGGGPYKAATGTGSYGYWGGGTSIPGYSLISRLDYSNDTSTSSPKGPLSVGMYRETAFSSRENGNPQTNSPYVPESLGLQAPFQPPFPFPVQAYNPANNFSYGYFGGGANPAGPHPHPRTTIDRIEYANDTSTATPKGTLSAIRYNYSYRSTGVSSPGFGYFLGFDGSVVSKADRIDYSNDTATATNVTFYTMPINNLGTGSASAGTANYGYIAGGVNHGAYITRIDYSNETTTSAANLTVERYASYGAAGNQSYGYFMGGYHPSTNPSYQSSVERLDYSSDTTTPTVKGPLNVGRQNFFGGVGNANYGYIGGGSPPFELSSVERIDFNNDTATASPKGPLSAPKQFISGTGTTSYGYVAGGEQNNPSYTTFSTIDRIDFASDTATASPKGPLSEAKMGTGSVSAATNAKTP